MSSHRGVLLPYDQERTSVPGGLRFTWSSSPASFRLLRSNGWDYTGTSFDNSDSSFSGRHDPLPIRHGLPVTSQDVGEDTSANLGISTSHFGNGSGPHSCTLWSSARLSITTSLGRDGHLSSKLNLLVVSLLLLRVGYIPFSRPSMIIRTDASLAT